jgi:hypothetical protein
MEIVFQLTPPLTSIVVIESIEPSLDLKPALLWEARIVCGVEERLLEQLVSTFFELSVPAIDGPLSAFVP